MNRLLIALFAGLLATGCSSGSSTEDDGGGEEDDGGTVVGEGDPTAITIEIESPERGTLSDSTQIVVTGRVTSSAGTIDAVTVNGGAATVSGDRFEVTLPLTQGITLIETVARDSAGNEAIDSRGVLAGTLVDQATPVTDGVVANVSSQAMTGLVTMVADLANSTDFNSLFDPNVPVVDTGDGCNSAKVFVDDIQLSGVEVDAGNVAGGIAADVSVRDLVVTGEVTFRAVCIGGSASFTMTATSYDVEGDILPGLEAGDITVGINVTRSDFAGFNVDVDNIPGFIESLFEGQVRTRVADTLRDTITSMIPPVVNSFLGDFLAESISIDLLGQTIELDITPAEMNWTEQGGTIALDTSATVAGVEGARYLSSPRPRPSDADLASTGLRVALADDVLNQLLANIWASGALEDTMLPVPGDALSIAFGPDVGSAAITMILPPVANFDTTTGTARLTVGDLMLEVISTGGAPLASFILSAEIDLAVETSADGTVRIITRAPSIVAQILSQSDALPIELTNESVAAIAELAIGQVSLLADDLLENLPVPGIAGATITQPTIQPAGGYLLLGGTLAFE